MIEDGLSYPVRGEWIGRILIGTVLGFLSVLLIPAIFLSGYFIRVMEHTTRGNDAPPAFTGWGSLFVDGIKAWIVGFVYAFVPTVIWFLVVTVILGASLGLGGEGVLGVGILALLTTMLMFLPLMLVLAYIVPAALANMASEGSLGAAFDFGALMGAWTSGDYFVAVVVAFVLSIGFSIVMQILAVTVVGVLLIPTLLFYSYAVYFRIWARGFAKAGGRSTGDPTASAPTA